MSTVSKNDLSSSYMVEEKLKEPSMYKVIMHNDDYTTMEFVVYILKSIFHKNDIDSNKIMMNIHKKGKGVAGVYTYDIANTKITQTIELAKENNFPLQCTLEENK